MLTRRDFLTACGSAAVLAQLAPARVLAARAGTVRAADADVMEATTAAEARVLNPSRQVFADLLGEHFDVADAAGRSLQLRLATVEDPCHSCTALEQFVLHFDGAPGTVLASGVHTVRHADAGSTSIRLERVADAGGATRYQAVFALLRNPA